MGKVQQALVELGQRAIDYYIDTGLCVFCDCNDSHDIPHEDHCEVGMIKTMMLSEIKSKKTKPFISRFKLIQDDNNE